MNRARTMQLGVQVSICAAGLCSVLGAVAQTSAPIGNGSYYSCRDASGRLITADRPIMECLNREQREHNRDGTVKRIIEAPLTPEQKRQRAEEEQRREEEQARLDEIKRHDAILLSSYSSVDSIERAQQRALIEPQSGIAKSQQRLADLGAERTRLNAETEFYKGRKLPGDLERKLQDNDAAQKYETSLLARRNAEIRSINERYAADKARFLELTGPTPRR